MGQYYKPVILHKDKFRGKNLQVHEWFYSHGCKSLWKRDDGKEFNMGSGLKLMEHSWSKNSFVSLVERTLVGYPKRLVWAGDYADSEVGTDDNIYDMCREKFEHLQHPDTQEAKMLERHPYLVNHSKMEYVDKRETPDRDGWAIHPLPLLTCEGNNRGGGDYRGGGGNQALVGAWARDLISVERLKPGKSFKKITFDLVEY